VASSKSGVIQYCTKQWNKLVFSAYLVQGKNNAMLQPKIVFIETLIKRRIDLLQSSFHQACEVVIK
jgi:hypothetical protein